MTSLKAFRLIPEGCGGIYTFNPASDKSNKQVEYIGTGEIETCASLFFPVDEGRCFFAHINIYFRSKSEEMSYVPGKTKGFELKEDTKAALFAESAREDWKYSKEAMRNGLIMVCPHEFELVDERRQTGFYVVQAVQEFLEFLDCKELRAEREYSGFIASIRHGLVEYNPHDQVKHSEEAPVTAEKWKGV